MADKLDFEKLNSMQRYTQWATFRAIPGALGTEREQIIAQAQEFFAALAQEGKVEVRGIYDITAGRAEADFMFWWHAEEFSDIQKAYSDFRRETSLGQLTEVFWLGNGLHRPSEFNKSHLPSFIMGEEPGGRFWLHMAWQRATSRMYVRILFRLLHWGIMSGC